MRKMSVGFGAFVLILSGFVCKLLGLLFRLPLTRLLGIGGIGVFQLVMTIYAFALVITSGGVTNSLSKLISSARAENKEFKVKTYFFRAMGFSCLFALVLGLVFLLFGKFISAFQGIEATTSYMLFLVLLPLGALLACLRGFFQGYENMVPTAVSQVVEQVFKFVFGLVFAYYFSKISTSAGVFGAFLGIVLSELFSFIYIFILFLLKNKHIYKSESGTKEDRREFDKANFLLTLSACILPLVNAFDALVIVPQLMRAGFSNADATSLFGLQSGIVGAILNFPLIISMSVTTTLLPNISYLISKGSGGRFMIEKGFKMLLFLILPTTFGVVAISKPLLQIFYPNISAALLNIAFSLMFYGGFAIIFMAIMQYLNMLLLAHGKFKFILVITAIAGVLKGAITFSLSAVASINIFALVIGNILLSSTVSVLALWKLKQISAFKVSFFELFLLIFATFLMFLAVFTFLKSFKSNLYLGLILAVLMGMVVYFVITIPYSIKILPKRMFKKRKES